MSTKLEVRAVTYEAWDPGLKLKLEFSLYRTGIVERYCVNLVLSWNFLVSPSMAIENFAEYSSLGWHLCSCRVCKTYIQELVAFRVSVGKSSVILVGLLLLPTWPFAFVALNTLCSIYLVF